MPFKKNLHIWLAQYLARRISPFASNGADRPVHVMFCVADHFEPAWRGAGCAEQQARVLRWKDEYPKIAGKYRDSAGRPPRHTFFYPAEEYKREHLDALSALVEKGMGEVEVHLHHDRDTEQGLREKLLEFKDILSGRHGMLSRDSNGHVRYGFVHGNWALDNSRKDGRWCGVNNELTVLKDTGCYADFTLPSAPSDTQTSKINSIYYATDDPKRPKSHNTGVDVRAGRSGAGDLMIVQGPLALSWDFGSGRIMPRIENSEIDSTNPATPRRIDQWVRQRIHVKGRKNWVFVKVHTHGAGEANAAVLLGRGADILHAHLQERYNDGREFMLHYVTAREVYNIVMAAEQGLNGNPDEYRDRFLKPVCR